MSEELTVDGAFGQATAVDGYTFLVSSWTQIVQNLVKDFLTNAILTTDEYIHVVWCGLNSCIYCLLKQGASANNLIVLLY